MQTIFPLTLIAGYNSVLFMTAFSNTDAEEETDFHLEVCALQREEQTNRSAPAWLSPPHGNRAVTKRVAGSPRAHKNPTGPIPSRLTPRCTVQGGAATLASFLPQTSQGAGGGETPPTIPARLTFYLQN